MDTFIFNENFLSSLSLHEKYLHVNGIKSSLFLNDYSPLFSFVLSNDLNSIRHYILFGHDLNKYNLKGLNLLHLIIILICHDSKYIKSLEYFLKLGANPNLKTFIFISNQLQIFNCLELFEYIITNQTIEPFQLPFQYNILNIYETMHVYLLLYIYNIEIYQLHPLNPCHFFKLSQINQDYLNYYECLYFYLHLYWKIYINNNNLLKRHLILIKNYNHIKYPKSFKINDGIYINKSFDENLNNVHSYEFLNLNHFNKCYYFHLEFLSYLILTNTNPLNNEHFDIKQKIKLLNYLEKFGNHSYNPDRHLNYPFLFSQEFKKPDLIKDQLLYIEEFIKIINPYTNILLLNKLNEFEILYYSLQLQNLNEFFQQTNQLNNLLSQIIKSFHQESFENFIYIVSYCFDEIYIDIQMYKKIVNIFNNKKLQFIMDFYEAILILEIFELFNEHFGSFNIYEFISYWEKILILFSIHNMSLLNETTFPLLLLSN